MRRLLIWNATSSYGVTRICPLSRVVEDVPSWLYSYVSQLNLWLELSQTKTWTWLSRGKWTFGALVNNVWSVAAHSDDLPDMNEFLLRLTNYNLKKGWYLTMADRHDRQLKRSRRLSLRTPLGRVRRIMKLGAEPVDVGLHVTTTQSMSPVDRPGSCAAGRLPHSKHAEEEVSAVSRNATPLAFYPSAGQRL
jgi:hypothetical protein